MHIRYSHNAVFIALGLLVSGCAERDIDSYAGKAPEITVREFYGAPIEGYGFFQDRSGKIKDRYFATLVPRWDGNEGTIIENQWNDKGQLYFHQTWKIHASDNGRDFTGTGTKIDGLVKGATSGFAMHMTYVLSAPTAKGDDVKLDAQDWTYLQPDGSGINKVSLSKYGIHVGDVTYVLHPVPKGKKLQTGYFIPSK